MVTIVTGPTSNKVFNFGYISPAADAEVPCNILHLVIVTLSKLFLSFVTLHYITSPTSFPLILRYLREQNNGSPICIYEVSICFICSASIEKGWPQLDSTDAQRPACCSKAVCDKDHKEMVTRSRGVSAVQQRTDEEDHWLQSQVTTCGGPSRKSKQAEVVHTTSFPCPLQWLTITSPPHLPQDQISFPQCCLHQFFPVHLTTIDPPFQVELHYLEYSRTLSIQSSDQFQWGQMVFRSQLITLAHHWYNYVQ